MKPRLNVVTLGVKSLDASREFYRSALGWESTKDSNEKIIFYNHGGIVFGLYPMDKLAEDALLPNNSTGISPIALAINVDSKEAVDQLYKQVIENGGKSLVEPRETFWGGYDCYFEDPNGQHWEIAWAPFWEFDEKGSLIVE